MDVRHRLVSELVPIYSPDFASIVLLLKRAALAIPLVSKGLKIPKSSWRSSVIEANGFRMMLEEPFLCRQELSC